MNNSPFQEIDSLHSELERMDKSAKLGWLMGQKMHLNRLANQFAQYIAIKGGFSNDDEKAYAGRLLEMINLVDAEGSKVVNDFANDAFMDLIKTMMR